MIGLIRIRKSHPDGQWTVSCPACADDLWFYLEPWARTVSHQAAIRMARLHVDLHAETRCHCCGHTPPVPKVVIGNDRTRFTIGDVDYRMDPSAIVRLEPSQVTT